MMSQVAVDRTIRYGVFAFLGGAICWFAGLVVSSMMLAGLGAMTGCFDNWRTERGLWMLGALFLLMFGGFYVIFACFQILDWQAGRAQLRGADAVDWFVGTTTLSFMVRFLWAVTYWNGQHTSES